jgi:hypothetical protein
VIILIHKKLVNTTYLKLSIYHFSFNSASELEIIARRHGFDELITSNQNSNWSNAGVFFTNKTIDSNRTEVQHTGLQFKKKFLYTKKNPNI